MHESCLWRRHLDFFPQIVSTFPSLRSSASELAMLISRMQANADQVEKDILETDSRLKQVHGV